MKYIVVLMVLCFAASGCSKEAEDRSVEISRSSVSVGAVFTGEEGMDNQKLAYSIVMNNPNNISIVGSADVIFTKNIKERITRIQYESVHYDDRGTITIAGEIIYDARGLTKDEVSQYDFLKGVQFIGDDNVEYFLPIIH
ncbi:hypothetical protein [Paenibacillus sp. GYB003]|uniref:hypothetical protein n=1 Tax=Paenibacillus sp. GYB003 TaxID=2994392 RepID=UPI002F961324